ncbi:MAG: hypothetical protein IKG01_03240 [Lachnospiraceae bacterium]|nr:hypothetical protein [Lachnospiraceae bacterium]
MKTRIIFPTENYSQINKMISITPYREKIIKRSNFPNENYSFFANSFIWDEIGRFGAVLPPFYYSLLNKI